MAERRVFAKLPDVKGSDKMKFCDYLTILDAFKKNVSTLTKREYAEQYGDRSVLDFKSFYIDGYNGEQKRENADPLLMLKLGSELAWYLCKRPFFNLYPSVEHKLLQLPDAIELCKLVLPFKSLEVRTVKRSVLISDLGHSFHVICQFPDFSHQEFTIDKKGSLGRVRNKEIKYTGENPGLGDLSIDELTDWVFVTAGVCLLASDKSIVSPVILNADRHDGLTADQLALLATKAINRTGRIGFDVGRDIERMKATAHYRNGCFAKYYVGKDHENYPSNADASLVPIIKWRSGAVVNKDNVPTVPTGYRDGETKMPD